MRLILTFLFEQKILLRLFQTKNSNSYFLNYWENQFTDVLIEIEYGICRYYLSIKNPLNFNFSTISMQMKIYI